ncbi:hypothetical protein N787_03620 [Arenimonas metalli CF5-1]|uniref:Uncharacterized protein n=1 Tax=Arenimonas metalli CF5-1 TaxID=1384056 RepID=A0A091AVP3_9GAMM|nr:hypothetical protein N787_03620 [Arenimonas metalli CF5-1]
MTSTKGVMFISDIVSEAVRAAVKAMALLLPGVPTSLYARRGVLASP